MIDLNPDHLETVRRILAEHVPACEVRVFGSRVTWTAKDYSDLDLAVVGVAALDWGTLGRLREAFEESDLPMQVDVLDWHGISRSFQEVIERDYAALQEMPSGQGRDVAWNLTTIGEFAPFVYGKGLPERERNSAGAVPMFGSNGIVGSHDVALTNGPTVVIGRKGTAGAVHYSPVPCWPIDTTFYVTGDDPDRLRFIFYALKTLDLADMNADSAVPGLNRTAAHARELRVPEKATQRAIAHILGTLDDKIQLNRRMNETLEGMARALFKSWFVDFEPVRAKMEGRWRRGESLPGMPAELYELFPDGMVDSELGEIPAGWEVRGLGELCHKPQYGYTATAKGDHVGPKFLRITDINKKAWIDWSSVPYCEITERDYGKYRLTSGDILIARMADPGHGVLIEEDLEAVFASYLIRFRPFHRQHGRLLQYWLRSERYWELVSGRAAGTTRTSLNAKVLSTFPVIVPSIQIAITFDEYVASLRSRVVANTSETRTHAAKRDTLLPKLISGEVRVKDAATFVERRS